MSNENKTPQYEHEKGALPFEINHGFTQIPNAILRHYQYYPQFNGATTVVYGVLLSHYNKAFGYAYPTQIQVAQAVNMSEKTAGKHIKSLAEVGLINVKKNGEYNNDTYTFNSPIENADDFFAKYPEACERWRKLDTQLSKRKSDKDVRKSEMTAQGDTQDVDKTAESYTELADWL